MEKTVLVLGAGFTRAFYPESPLMEAPYDGDLLTEAFEHFPEALLVLEQERRRHGKKWINIERLMTRLEGGMPYDKNRKAYDELQHLLSRVKSAFIGAIARARQGSNHESDLRELARFCLYHQVECITYNYDDAFDEALYTVGGENYFGVTVNEWQGIHRYWNPDTGYGFRCERLVTHPNATPQMASMGQAFAPQQSSIKLLKLHGSMNWRIRMGAPTPYELRSIVHHEDWKDPLLGTAPDGRDHLEPSPFIVPPVLVKSDLVEQPILRHVWSKAYETLTSAQRVVFLGYSFPTTDVASIHLFSEAIKCPDSNIRVVDFNPTNDSKVRARIEDAYRRVFPGLDGSQFDFRGAREWAKLAIKESPPIPIPRPTS